MSGEREDFTPEEHAKIEEMILAWWGEIVREFDEPGVQVSAALSIAANLAAMALECVKGESQPQVRRMFLDTCCQAEEVLKEKKHG